MNMQLSRSKPAPGKERSQAVIDEAVRRHLEDGEAVPVLCKYYGISRAGFYNWVNKYKERVLDASRKEGMTPAALKSSEKQELVIEVQSLRLENKRLRDRLVQMMLKYGHD